MKPQLFCQLLIMIVIKSIQFDLDYYDRKQITIYFLTEEKYLTFNFRSDSFNLETWKSIGQQFNLTKINEIYFKLTLQLDGKDYCLESDKIQAQLLLSSPEENSMAQQFKIQNVNDYSYKLQNNYHTAAFLTYQVLDSEFDLYFTHSQKDPNQILLIQLASECCQNRQKCCGNCTSGYYKDNQEICQICSKPCKECINNKSNCTACYHNSKLNQSINQCECEIGYQYNEIFECVKQLEEVANSSSQHNQFYILNCNFKCLECQEENPNKCTKCDEIQKRILDNFQCKCINGFFEVKQQICIECNLLCETCNGSNRNNCLSCNENQFRILNQKNQCECQSPYIEEENSMICKSYQIYLILQKVPDKFNQLDFNLSNTGLNTLEQKIIIALDQAKNTFQNSTAKYFFEIFQQLGYIFYLTNNQAIAQLRFLNVIPPVNVYNTEVLIAKFTFINKFPPYHQLEQIPEEIVTSTFKFKLSSEYLQSKYQIFINQGFSTIFFFNCHLTYSIFFLFFLVWSVSYIWKKEKQLHKNFKIHLDNFLSEELLKGRTENLYNSGENRLKSIQFKIYNWTLFFQKSQIANLYLSVFLQFSRFQTPFTTSLTILSLIFSFHFIFTEIIFKSLIFKIQRDYDRIRAKFIVTKDEENKKFLENFIKQEQNTFWFLFTNRQITTKWQKYFWLISLFKKIYYAFVITYIYDTVLLQLISISIIFFSVSLLKLKFKIYSRKWEFLISIVIECLILVLLIIKQFENKDWIAFQKEEKYALNRIRSWVYNGWKTVIVEIIIISLLVIKKLMIFFFIIKSKIADSKLSKRKNDINLQNADLVEYVQEVCSPQIQVEVENIVQLQLNSNFENNDQTFNFLENENINVLLQGISNNQIEFLYEYDQIISSEIS